MASVFRRDNGSSAVQFNLPGCRRQTLHLGKVSDGTLEEVRRHVEELVIAVRTNSEPAGKTRYWLAEQPDAMIDKLVSLGLTKPRVVQEQSTAPTLGDYLAWYAQNRSSVEAGTKETYHYVARNLTDKFGAGRRIDTFTEGDAEDFKTYLDGQTRLVRGEAVNLAPATIKRRLKTAKQFFERAVKDRVLPSNPFAYDGVNLSSKGNDEKFHEVSLAEVDAVIAACPDVEWRLIVALVRFGGLRCPSEVVALQWDDVLWDSDRFIVRSKKTKRHEGKKNRIVPIFPELAVHLREAFEQAKPGAVHVITRYREKQKNVRTQFARYVKAAGLKPWPKPFINMRSMRAIELRERFPDHVVNKWIGHCQATASGHYLRVLESHWQSAAATQTDAARQSARQQRSAGDCRMPRTSNVEAELQGGAPSRNDMQLSLSGPQGFEP